ncbi:hypothetical protein F5X98DRAFT_332492 [Xylaria grammica]|nr:hypothetical protein F5X98DRAFT_332492 [Xylaria grammica]
MLNLFGTCTCTSSAIFRRRLCSVPRLRCSTLRGFHVREDISLRASGKPSADAFAYTSSTNHISADPRARGSRPLTSSHNGETPTKEIETDTPQPVATALATIAPGLKADAVTTTAASVVVDECLLREMQKIRHLFGYSDASQQSSRTKVSGFGQTLSNSLMKDVLLVAIDVDTWQGYESLATKPELHIGISILDTRLLHTLALEAACGLKPIKSYQFVVGNSHYCRRASRRFLFGKSQSISVPKLNIQFESLIHSKNRDIVLVLHGGVSDLKALRHLSIDLQPLYIIDTALAAQYSLGLHSHAALQLALQTFNIPHNNLHAAGNDAHYALRSLLMIATADAERMGHHLTYKTVLTDIARKNWVAPTWKDPVAKQRRAVEQRRVARREQTAERQRINEQEYAARARRAAVKKLLSEKEAREKKERRAEKAEAKKQAAKKPAAKTRAAEKNWAERKRAGETEQAAEMEPAAENEQAAGNEQAAEMERAAEKEKAAGKEGNGQQRRDKRKN